MAVITHKSLHSRSWSSSSSNDFQEHLPIWWRIWCHQSTSQWWLTANCCCWVFAEWSSPAWHGGSQPGARSQAALGEIQQGEVLVFGLFLGSTFCPWLPALFPVPKTFTRTCFESSWARRTPSPVTLRLVQGRSVMKVMKDGVCPFLFQVFPLFWDLNTQESHPSQHRQEIEILQKSHFFPSCFQLHPSSSSLGFRGTDLVLLITDKSLSWAWTEAVTLPCGLLPSAHSPSPLFYLNLDVSCSKSLLWHQAHPPKPQCATTSVFSFLYPTLCSLCLSFSITSLAFSFLPHQSLRFLLLPFPLLSPASSPIPFPPLPLLSPCFSPLTFPSLSFLSQLAMMSSSCSWGHTWRWTFLSHWARISSWPSARSPDKRPLTTQRRRPATARPVAQVHRPEFPKIEGRFL